MSGQQRVVGVDVGGTFTDLFVLDEADQSVAVVKVPSTRGEEAVGFMNGIARLDDAAGGAAGIATIIHGTTVGTNALLERKAARTGLITTRGFADVLEMRRRDRPHTWGLRGEYLPPISRDLRKEVDERVLADGSIHTEVDLDQVEACVRELLAQGCEAVCVFFINTYANPANEAAAVARVRELWPNDCVTSSAEVLPEIREFERVSTASLNAALQPVVGGYLRRLEGDLRERGFGGQLMIVQSNGGVMSRQTACELPVRTTLSGPAAGVIACAAIARAAGHPDVMTGDMGGTSFDVSLVVDGRVALAEQTSIAFGMVVRSPMIQIETIGAGGGSIAKVDAGGMLQVGPESAGSRPGPACYGHGNPYPTVTDANLLLGRIDAARPLGGGLLGTLDAELARAAIHAHVAEPLGLDVLEAAEAILTVANAKMAGALRLVSIEKGHDPRRFAYMPFGGGGGLHVCAMMRETGVETGIVPRYPGVTSALGCVMADLRHDAVRTINRGLHEVDFETLRALVGEFRERCDVHLASAGVAIASVREELFLDMLYQGQTHTVMVPVQADHLHAGAVAAAFEAAYRAEFGRLLPGIAVRIMNLRYARIGVRPKFDLRLLAPPADARPRPADTQRVHVNGAWMDVPRHARLELPVGTRVEGPAILEQPDTTVWLEPGFSATTDDHGNLILKPV
ncbi:hydantoinase/oxoprolinase family protein [Pigmentiphaga sp. D-2]|uniref:hydantoinase/oxoprolinase family protein n=1 Tax=Pigmentiphaga sp. D-2 TaxID=1002116 RepID=UPI0010480D3D|nr:hydantoinase/oxoprolinase family protein [Pigmentiphaga sp. D-2]